MFLIFKVLLMIGHVFTIIHTTRDGINLVIILQLASI